MARSVKIGMKVPRFSRVKVPMGTGSRLLAWPWLGAPGRRRSRRCLRGGGLDGAGAARSAVESRSRTVGAAAGAAGGRRVFTWIRPHLETFLIGIGLSASVAYVIATIAGALGTAATGAVPSGGVSYAHASRDPGDGIISTMSTRRGPRRAIEQSLEPGGDVIPP